MTEIHDERVHTEHLVLDIGGDIGALILYTNADRCNDEIEISPKGSDSHRQHNQVHERSFNGTSVFSAVYPELPAGTYDIWQDDETRAGTVEIVGGKVAEVDWRF
jgi:hypothetical protein